MKLLYALLIMLVALTACQTAQTAVTPDVSEPADMPETPAAPQEIAEPAQPAQEPAEPTMSEPESEPMESTMESEPAQVQETITKPAQSRTKLYQFLDTFRERVNGYFFDYNQNRYLVRGTTYKIQLTRPVMVQNVKFGNVSKSSFTYDTVYVDRATKTAVAYCEGHDSEVNRQCERDELLDLAYPVSYSDYDITLPEDWLMTYLDSTPRHIETKKYYIKDRSATTVIIPGIPEVELNFDPSTGLVIRADLKEGNRLSQRYDYERLSTGVREVDVIHRSKSEIPSEEVFTK